MIHGLAGHWVCVDEGTGLYDTNSTRWIGEYCIIVGEHTTGALELERQPSQGLYLKEKSYLYECM
jgi:hypothetical protein